MRNYKIKSAITTVLFMRRHELISKEKVKQKYIFADPEEIKNEARDFKSEISVNDDLESLHTRVIDLHQTKKLSEEIFKSFLTQKLNSTELRLLDTRNKNYLKSFMDYNESFAIGAKSYGLIKFNYDIDQIKKSKDSRTKFAHSICTRRTFSLQTNLD